MVHRMLVQDALQLTSVTDRFLVVVCNALSWMSFANVTSQSWAYLEPLRTLWELALIWEGFYLLFCIYSWLLLLLARLHALLRLAIQHISVLPLVDFPLLYDFVVSFNFSLLFLRHIGILQLFFLLMDFANFSHQDVFESLSYILFSSFIAVAFGLLITKHFIYLLVQKLHFSFVFANWIWSLFDFNLIFQFLLDSISLSSVTSKSLFQDFFNWSSWKVPLFDVIDIIQILWLALFIKS